jgi:thiol-disulfide isomerase/thioredoxin
VWNNLGVWAPFAISAKTSSTGSFQFVNAPAKPSTQYPIGFAALLPSGHLVGLSIDRDNASITVVDRPVHLRVLVTTGGSPVPGARVTVERVYSVWNAQPKPTVIYTGYLDEIGKNFAPITNSRGVAMVGGLPAGGHAAIRVFKPGLVRFTKVLDLPVDRELSVDAPMTKGAIFSGKVLFAGKPVSNVKVTAWVRGKYMYNGFDASTGPDGEYRIEDGASGEAHLDAEPGPLHPNLVARTISDLKLAEGSELDGLNFVLEKGVLVRGQVRTVASSIPVAGASVVVVPEGAGAQNLITDAKGQFAALVPAGSEDIWVSEIGERRISNGPNARVTIDAQHNPVLDLPVDDVLALPAIPHLTGVALDASGNPVSGATVFDIGSPLTALTDDKGRFEFKDPTHPGEQIIATKGDAVTKLATVLSDKASIVLRLDSKSSAVNGIVVGEDGIPIPGVELSIGGTGAIASTVAKTDSQGRYRFEGLVSGLGDFFVWSKKAGYGAATIQPIEVGPAESKSLPPLKIMLADGTIDGKVVDPDGKPAIGVLVSGQSSEVPSVKTDEQGAFHLTQVPRGKFWVIAKRSRSFEAQTLVNTGQTDVVIKLTPPAPATPGAVQQELPGKDAPALKVSAWVDGKPLDIKRLKGKIVVVDFWAVWCAPCVAALPKVQALADGYGKHGVVVLGVHATGTPMAKLRAFVKQKGLTYPIALDSPDATGLGSSAFAYQPKGWPTVYVIAPNGRILVESNDIEDAVKAVEKLVAK